MLLLLFYAGCDLYAIDSLQVVEIIAHTNLQNNLQKVHHCPEYVAGLLNYRDQMIPVIDLCYLLHRQPSRPYLSTRIMIVKATKTGDREGHLGLMAERVTETLKISETTLRHQVHPLGQVAHYLGEMIIDEQRMIQCLHLERLLATIPHVSLAAADRTARHLSAEGVEHGSMVWVAGQSSS